MSYENRAPRTARSRSFARTALAGVTALLVVVLVAAGCSSGGSSSTNSSSGTLQVVAAENFWGSIASQLAGDKAAVTSIITNPDTDPHDYEAKPADGRTIASAKYVIVNGIGYDPWAQKLLNANPDSSRKVLDVGKLVGVSEGGNPHQWYSPTSVQKFVDQVTTDLKALDPKNAAFYDEQKASYESSGLKEYKDLIAQIDRQYAGTPVGASESIVAPLAEALGLKMLTPESFLDAIAEGNDPTAADKTTVDEQIAGKRIKVFVFNSQNSTPDVKRLVDAARSQHIPVTTVTETLTPAGATFQAWQSRQLRTLRAALAQAAGTG